MTETSAQHLKLLPFFGLLLIVAGLFAGCADIDSLTDIVGSSTTTNLTKDFKDFDKVRISHGFAGEIRAGKEFSVQLEVSENLVKHLLTEVVENELRIGLKPGISASNATLKLTITMPTLTSLNASGGSRLVVAGFQSADKNLTLDGSGGSTFELDVTGKDVQIGLSGGSDVRGKLTATSVDMEFSGGSKAVLTGSADTLLLKGSGGSSFKLSGFSVKEATVDFSGGSTAELSAGKVNEKSLSGGSSYNNKKE